MKRLLLSLFVLVGSVAAWCQASPAPGAATAKAKPVSPLVQFAGEWTSAFDGKVWLRLQLEVHGEQLVGSLIHPKNITMNDNGDLKSISEEDSIEPVIDAVVNPDGLLLTFKDTDTQEADRYMMRVIPPEKQTADLKMIGMAMPPGMPKPKPWRLVKSGGAARGKSELPR